MANRTRNLLISLASHMAYMQGQLEAFTQQSDPEDFYWYRESVALRQKVIDALDEGDGSAVPEGREPTDEELLELMPETMRDEFSYAAKQCSDATGGQVKPGIFRLSLNTAALEYARAVLARWGLPAPVPVPVSERVPEAEDCDAEGRCWLLTYEDDYPQWRLHSIQGAQPGGVKIWVPVATTPGDLVDCFYTSHWLPANAVPLPAVEVEP